MNEEIFKELWLVEGTEEELAELEAYLQEKDIKYAIKNNRYKEEE